jgi:RNA polymerase sigma factor (sigma-70 family)
MAAGDPAAIETFYHAWFDWLHQQARKTTGRDEAFCLDVVQDALIRVLRSVQPVREERSLRAWLRLVIRTSAYDRLRADVRWKRRHEGLPPTRDEGDDAEERQRRLRWLQNELESLDPKLVRLLNWRYEQSWSLRRIAETLGVTAGAVDGRLRRALRALRRRAKDAKHD